MDKINVSTLTDQELVEALGTCLLLEGFQTYYNTVVSQFTPEFKRELIAEQRRRKIDRLLKYLGEGSGGTE